MASRGVAYEWANLPTGITTVEGNVRKLIGGSSLSTGTYSPTMTAINYAGEDVETLTITVSDPPLPQPNQCNLTRVTMPRLQRPH